MMRELDWKDCREALRGKALPAAFVDLTAFDSNLDEILRMMGDSDKTLRIASKSIRCVGLLKRLFERSGGRLKGVMCYDVSEARHLTDHGFDDLLVAYPTAQPSDLQLLCKMTASGTDATLIVDSVEQIRAMEKAGREAGVELQAAIEADMSWRPFGDAAHFGVRRSAVRDGVAAVRLAEEAKRAGGVRVVGVMGYEAQIAGLGDKNPFSPALNPVRRFIRRGSKPHVAALRKEIVESLWSAGVELRFVNGGGTGSVDFTGSDDAVTEATAGSGFFCPHLFDGYSNLNLRPVAFFALQVVRRPAKNMIACQGGGYIASGQPGRDRLPLPWLPKGLRYVTMEGAGEVQTPLIEDRETGLEIGDPVIFRHAKGGELRERFNELLLIQDGKVVGEEKTYRGEGKCFL